MALPLTNLTAWFDFSDNTTVFEAAADPAEENDPVELIVSGNSINRGLSWIGATGDRPTYRTSAPVMALSNSQWTSASRLGLYSASGSGAQAMSNIVANNAKTLIISIYPTAIDANNANPYDNDYIFGDGATGFVGLYLKNPSAGVYEYLAYNFDGTADAVALTLPDGLNASYVLMMTHDGVNIVASVNGDTPSSVASGNTTNLGTQCQLGALSTPAFVGYIGEVVAYNAALTGSTLDDAVNYFTAKWLGAGPAPGGTRTSFGSAIIF